MPVKNKEEIKTIPDSQAPQSPKKKRKYFFKFIIFLIIIGLAGATGYYYKQYKKIKDNPNVVAQEELKIVTDALSKLMELPEGEEPTLATVQDKEKLKEQDFFKKSENGDKILIYAAARKAIIYRPSANKVIEVAPLVLDQGAQDPTQNTAVSNEKSNETGQNQEANTN